jgi:hypothetical protein
VRPAARKERGGNSKTTRVIALLRRPEGATLAEIMPYASHCTSLA